MIAATVNMANNGTSVVYLPVGETLGICYKNKSSYEYKTYKTARILTTILCMHLFDRIFFSKYTELD